MKLKCEYNYKMSTETLKFFENRTTEEIINWMLDNLSEEQIRMCLDQSGIPNTNLVESQDIAPVREASPPPVRQSPGAGSSTDPLPPTSAVPTPITDVATPDVSLLSINIDLLYKYREKCKGTQYIIKSVSNQGIEYYEFKEVEDEDNVISPNITSGDVGWVKKIVPVSEFDEF